MEQNAVAYLKQFPQQTFAKGDYIIRQGEAAEYVYYLAQGRCLRNCFTQKGDEIIYTEWSADQSASCLLGALTLYCPTLIHESNIVARTTCTCCKLSASDFMDFVSRYPFVLHELLKMAMQEYRDSNTNFQFKQKGLAASHVCRFILSNARVHKDPLRLDKRFSISEIARYSGLHRVTVNKIILALCRTNCLAHTENGLRILDQEQLKRYAYGDLKLDYLHRPL